MSAIIDYTTEDLELIAGLPDAEKERIGILKDLLQRVIDAPSRRTEIRMIERELDTRGFDEKSIYRALDVWETTGSLFELARKKYKDIVREIKELTPEERDLFRTYIMANQRGKLRPAHKVLMRDLRNGKVFPGIGSWKDLYRRDFCRRPPDQFPKQYIPKGWSYSTFLTCKLTPFQVKAITIGLQSAKQHAPMVFPTRVGLEVGQFQTADDLWHDCDINLLGINDRSMRPLEYNFMDIFSAKKFAYGLKPMEWDQEAGKRRTLNRRDFLFLFCHVLTEYGYRPAGTTFSFELGAANLTNNKILDIIGRATNHAITFHHGGIDRKASVPGLFDAPAKGNPRVKALLESHHNMMHNATAHLPARIGKDRDHRPEEYSGRSAYNRAMIKAIQALPADLVEQLRWPVPLFNTYSLAIDQIYREIEDRIDHDIEGFEAARLVTWEYRLSDGPEWTPCEFYYAATPEERAAIDMVIRNNPARMNPRKMSPAEVYDQGRAKLKRIPHYVVPMLLAAADEDYARPVKVDKSGYIMFDDRELHTDQVIFKADLIKNNGVIAPLTPGMEFLSYINPFDTRYLYLSLPGKDKGAFVGLCRRQEVVSPANREAVKHAQAEQRKETLRLLKPLEKLGAQIGRDAYADDKHNAEIYKLAHAAVDFTKRPVDEYAGISVVDELNS